MKSFVDIVVFIFTTVIPVTLLTALLTFILATLFAYIAFKR